MRAGNCTLQQALTPEATAVVKQAVGLARRRGNAQVTPLHVASTMLSPSSSSSGTTGLLRAACLQSHSHPLQCKALELCFNVALNRLPASTSSGSPFMSGTGVYHHHHHHPPALSNALVAAFKRAQAHQRRGAVDSQQQPLLAVKIEVEQLVISILDDPSVSRVMREAGFSSTQVKANVEKAVVVVVPSPSSSETASASPCTAAASPSPPANSKNHGNGTRRTSPPPSDLHQAGCRDEDVAAVMDCLASGRRRSVVVVGECLQTIEGVMRRLMERVERGSSPSVIVPEALRGVQFLTLPLYSFAHLSREEVGAKVAELRCLVKSCCLRGLVLYLGDLKWTAGYRASSGEKGRAGRYCPVEHVAMELGRLASCSGGGEEGGRFWIVGVATYQTYMRCRSGSPSLEAMWDLHPLTVPAGGLGLSLGCDSGILQNLRTCKRTGDGSHWSSQEGTMEHQLLNCCVDCSGKFDIEARALSINYSNNHNQMTSNLPSWLQEYKDGTKRATNDDQDQEKSRLGDLCKKWNSICDRSHGHERTINFSVVSPCLSPISTSYDHQHHFHQPWPATPLSARHPWKERPFWASDSTDEPPEPDQHGLGSSPFPLTNPNPKPSPISSSSSEAMEVEHHPKFKELNAENLKILCTALERKVPWQMDIIPEIASTILQCRSGMVRRKDRSHTPRSKEDTWMFFQGCDSDGKEKIARELAKLVFGSYNNFVSIGLCCFSPLSLTKSGSTEELRNKRSRSEASHSYLERLTRAVIDNPHRVFFVDVEQLDYCSQIGIKKAIQGGTMCSSDGVEVVVGDAIVILSSESYDPRSRSSSPPVKQRSECEVEMKMMDCDKESGLINVSLDLNLSAGEEEDADDGHCFDDVCLVESVDRSFVFRLGCEL